MLLCFSIQLNAESKWKQRLAGAWEDKLRLLLRPLYTGDQLLRFQIARVNYRCGIASSLLATKSQQKSPV